MANQKYTKQEMFNLLDMSEYDIKKFEFWFPDEKGIMTNILDALFKHYDEESYVICKKLVLIQMNILKENEESDLKKRQAKLFELKPRLISVRFQ